jgi:hypothetical protein
MTACTAHFSHYDRSGVDAEPHSNPNTIRGLQAGIQCSYGLDNPQTRSHGAVRIVFVGSRVAKVYEKPITEILRDMTVKVLDDLRRRLLVGTHDLAEVFGIELAG